MVHCDRGYGLLAAVLYLCDGVGGTAFWTHATTGRRAYTGSPDDPCLKDISDDGAWHLRRVVDLKFNRLVVYPTAMWHSRFPRPAWGNCPHSGRLIAIGFY
ncbi:MAG: hypothetical protein ACREYE_23540 [Gammaproteobacteria bacterium]